MRALFGMGLEELSELMVGLGEKPYRGRQVHQALYRQLVGSVEEMSVLPVALRERMAVSGFVVGRPEMVQTATSVDGTERYLMRMADGETVETVWMPEGDGGERGDGSEAAAEELGEVDVIEVGNANAGPSAALRFAQDDSFLVEGEVFDPTLRGEAAKDGAPGVFAGAGIKADPSAALRDDDKRALGDDQTSALRDGGGQAAGKKRWQDVGVLEGMGYRRATICISSQVGCAVNCQFCLTAKLGIKRNLTAGEIAGQVAAVVARHGVKVGKDRINLVFMGMGEPFLNYDSFMDSVRLLSGGMGLPESRMTVSTSGIEPSIRRFALEPVRPKLALSLNASNDAVRERIMPITRKWNIQALLDAVATIPMTKREYVTFEYVLLGGVNDQPVHAREVLALLRGMRAKVNLIVWNPGPGIEYVQPVPGDVAVFQKMLIEGGIPTYIRRPRGRDIYAACGQLKRTVDGVGAGPLVSIAAAG
ncbi:MAG: 23S rRNA (adenine(2503)-C(2))-methyltransferase RlmN [Granulicella sp.]